MKEVRRGIYKDSKGERYEVICNAKYIEKDEDLVIYKSRESGKIWAIPVDEFLATEKNRLF